MALNLKLADAYVDLSMRTQKFDSGYAALLSRLRSIPALNVVVNADTSRFRSQMISVDSELRKVRQCEIQIRVDRSRAVADLRLIDQQIQAMRQQAAAPIVIRTDLRQWNRAVTQCHRDLSRLKQAATIPPLSVAVNVSTSRFRSQMVSMRNELWKLRRFTIQIRIDRSRAVADLRLLNQQIQAVRRRATANIAIRADLRQWNRALAQCHLDIHRLKQAANISVRANTSSAHSTLNLLLQHLRTLQGQTRFHFTGTRSGWWPNGRGWGGGGGGGGGGGNGPGFLSGLWTGAGLPYAANPAMMAGEMVSRGAIGAIKTAADMEMEFATLKRITGLTADEMSKFKIELMKFATSTPGVATQDLVEMAQIGGRMGVADRGGVKGLESFTTQLARVKLAITDVPTEDLANGIGRILNVFDLGTDRVAGFGSALTAMDNVSTASSRDILDITQRLSGTAKAIGLTLPQVTALSSVLKDVGLSNEVAGSSFSQIFRKMATDAGNFAEQIGVDAKVFADAYRRDPMEALGMVIKRFNEFKDTISGQEFLDDLKLKGVRVAGAIQQLSSKFPEVARRADIASKETSTTASLKAAEKTMGDTTVGSFEKAKNSVGDLADAVGGRLNPVARLAADGLADVAGALANVVRGTNQVSFSAPSAEAAKALEALPAKQVQGQEAEKPKTVEEAREAYDAAKERASAAETEAFNLHKELAQRSFEARQLMVQAARNPEMLPKAEAAFNANAQLKTRSEEAAQRSVQAGDAFRQAATNLREAELTQAHKQEGFDRENQFANAKQRVGDVVGRLLEARQAVLGIGAKTAIQAVNTLLPDKDKTSKKMPEAHANLSIGSSMLDVGRRIQEEVLRGNKADSPAVTKTEQNTRSAASLLTEVRDILKSQAQKVGNAVLAQ